MTEFKQLLSKILVTVFLKYVFHLIILFTIHYACTNMLMHLIKENIRTTIFTLTGMVVNLLYNTNSFISNNF